MLPHLKRQEGDWGRGVGREGADGQVGGVGLTVGPNVPSKAQAGGSVSWFPPIHSSPQSLRVQQITQDCWDRGVTVLSSLTAA